jgi:hypothetical protein
MFKINRRSGGSGRGGVPISNYNSRSSSITKKSVLKRSISDSNKLNKKITT